MPSARTTPPDGCVLRSCHISRHVPGNFGPSIGIIGCGGIVKTHLEAYKKARYQVVALVDLVREKAEQLRDTFYPNAVVYDTARAIARARGP